MEIALRFLRYSEKIARAYSTIAQNSTLWKSTLSQQNLMAYVIRRFTSYLFLLQGFEGTGVSTCTSSLLP